MIRAEPPFLPLFLASVAVHGVLFYFVLLLPNGGPHESVDIYRINIVEAPSQPTARALTVATRAISALKLEPPSLQPIPPEPSAPVAQPPAPAELPAAPRVAPPSMPPAPPAPPAAEAPPGAPPQAQAPRLDPGGRVAPGAAPLPRLPDLPAAPPTAPVAAERPATPPPTAQPPAAPAAQGLLSSPTPLQALREKVQKLELTVESPPAAGAAPSSGGPRNPLALRRYQSRIQEEVQRNYTFPGDFPPGLVARVRVVIARNGDKLQMEIIQTSGDERFDYTVLLTLRGAQFPPIPPEIGGDTLVQTFLFSPN
ncbi:MAG: TonB C-terminal domain-containing protein [Candidatus Lambdaproteobacteria bacterium]|nr:TonB C-terminal domain-containing protein [Candidatus Lambdaproteobacteria bacterium]